MTTNEKKAQVVKDAVEVYNKIGISHFTNHTKKYTLKKASKLQAEYNGTMNEGELRRYLFTDFYGKPWKQHHTYINDVAKQIRLLASW
jgi:hypothetical protein